MRSEVLLTEDANRDLENIYSYVAVRYTLAKAEDLVDLSPEVAESLSRYRPDSEACAVMPFSSVGSVCRSKAY